MPVAHEARRLLDDTALSFAPATYDAAAGEVDVVWSTGAPVRRSDWWSGESYDEELDLAGARLERLNQGAPLLLDHSNRVASVVGSVIPGTARVASGGGRARLRFDRSSDEGRLAEGKVAGGHVRHVSVGYVVTTWDKVETDGLVKRWIARDWEPFEISLVGAPADAGAGFRSGPSAAAHPLSHNAGAERSPATPEARMSAHTSPSAAPEGALAHDHADAVRQERARSAEIRKRCQAIGLPGTFADRLVEEGVGIDTAATRMVDELARRCTVAPKGPMGEVGTSYDEGPMLRSAMSEALAARMLNQPPSGPAERYRGWSVPEMARQLIETRGVSTRGWSPSQIMDDVLSRGMHTTSDFPMILGNGVNRTLAELYKRAQSPIRANLCRVRDAADFRELTTVRTSDFPALERVGEAGEVKRGTLRESGETYKVETYARSLGLSRQAMINDDLGAFAQATRSIATAGAETEAKALLELLIKANGAGPVLSDGIPLFAVSRPTLADTGAVINVASASAGRAAMRRQKDLGDGGPVGIGPKFLVVGAEQETAADQLVAAVQSSQVDAVNPFANKLVPLVEPRLSGKGWYLFADPVEAAVFEVAYLGGRTAPQVQSFEEANTLGVTMRAVFDFGAGVIGWRGAWRNPGA